MPGGSEVGGSTLDRDYKEVNFGLNLNGKEK